MKQTIKHETLGEIVYQENFWTGKKDIFINGSQLEKTAKNVYQIADGETAELKGNFFKGATLSIGSENIRVAPPIKWYEIVLSILPFILIMIWGNSVALCKLVPVIGGAIGGAISALLSAANMVIIKRIDKIWLKILISIAMLGATFGICCGLGYAFVAALS